MPHNVLSGLTGRQLFQGVVYGLSAPRASERATAVSTLKALCLASENRASLRVAVDANLDSILSAIEAAGEVSDCGVVLDTLAAVRCTQLCHAALHRLKGCDMTSPASCRRVNATFRVSHMVLQRTKAALGAPLLRSLGAACVECLAPPHEADAEYYKAFHQAALSCMYFWNELIKARIETGGWQAAPQRV